MAADDAIEIGHAVAWADEEAVGALAVVEAGAFAIGQGETCFAAVAAEGVNWDVVRVGAYPFTGVCGDDSDCGVLRRVTFSSLRILGGRCAAAGEDEVLCAAATLVPTRAEEGEGAAFLRGARLGGDVFLIRVSAKGNRIRTSAPS